VKKSNIAGMVGKVVAQRAIGKGIKKVVFDRNGFLYHGRIKAVSDGARESGLDF
jgi:large subunit ribosomal protein L18